MGSGGTVSVVREKFHENRGPARAVALVADLHEIIALGFARAPLDRALDIVFRHGLGLGLVHRETQARIETRIAPSHSRRNGDFTRQFGEKFAALLVLRTLAVLNIGPLAMTCHT